MRCRKYLIVTGYVDQSKLFTRAYRLLLELSSTEMVRAYEEARRITAVIDASRLADLLSLCRAHISICMVEVKASCRLGNAGRLIRVLKNKGFTLLKGAGAVVAYGVIDGRIVEVEVVSGRVKVKVGSKVTADRVKPPVPGSLFSIGANEAAQALEHLDKVLSLVEGAIHA